MYYSPIFILQLFCAYHVYKNRQSAYWYFGIFFLPVLGCLFYLYTQFVNRQNVDKVANTFDRVIKNETQLKRLIKELEFSDTLTNRLNLGNEYLRLGDAPKAIEHFEACLIGAHSQDYATLYKLLQANYEAENYEKVIEIREVLQHEINFHKSIERIGYAFSLHYAGNSDAAKAEFEDMDVQYSNFEHRLSYSQFLKESGAKDEAKLKLSELLGEIENMDRTEMRFKADIIRKIKKGYNQY
ncbi:MAG: hypothetical protein ACI959_000852 [Limisphaerales bacterium]|jgi:hypothetical protein